ncbi:monoamine oxidase [Saccharopolyspora lacisalsi]|uniref:Monoamine oxidase n=1 Tax=Halosaccharopolyspora lacisalsi TaxID=1000566 RepID=A0A839E4F6_9PSEU|nr:FAD-dependent oxidoreductase [Halosaccharopolyspora lacisalsi]MBA8827920.1 monoamine oxidase [Halosaccharopolyspora lacisalsi]
MSRVAIIGAGVAGLAAAYRLHQSGHDVTVLEAKSHAGGLSQTARDGSVVTELHDGERVAQTVRLPEGHYVNLGPGRLPHHHRRMLGLCHELGVELETYIMSSDANLYADTATGGRYSRRRLANDMRGYVAEKAYAGLSGDGAEMARAFGDLDGEGIYRGTGRSPGTPLKRDELARMRAWQHLFLQPLSHYWQNTLFQPVGGMDRVWRAILAQVEDSVQYNAPVQRIQQRRNRVQVTWTWGGYRTSESFDWCLSSAPLPHVAEHVELKGFDREFTDAVESVEFAPACKVGWYSRTRWWEDEEIYGGISYSDHDIQQFWYPSSGHFGADGGTLTGAYNSYEAAERFQAMSVPDRIATARQGGSLLHEQVADPSIIPTENAATVAWARVPYQRGGWAHWRPDDPKHRAALATLRQPAGRFGVIGDQVSDWPGWQEGAVWSAERALAWIHDEPTGGAEPAETEVPDSRWLTTGVPGGTG